MCLHPIFELCDRISSRKRKGSRNRYCLFVWGLGINYSMYAGVSNVQYVSVNEWSHSLDDEGADIYVVSQLFQLFSRWVVVGRGGTLHSRV